MQTLVLLSVSITGLVLVGGAVVAVIALRRAPEGVEDERGFHETAPAETPEPRGAPDRIPIRS